MKWTKKKIIYTVLELIFIAAVPVALIVAQFFTMDTSMESTRLKVSVSGILLLIIAFVLFKKLFINGKLEDMRARSNTFLADLETENIQEKIINIEEAVKRLKTLEIIINAVLPLCFLGAVFAAFKGLEKQVVELSGTVGFMILSYITGVIFSVLAAREVNSKHKEQK